MVVATSVAMIGVEEHSSSSLVPVKENCNVCNTLAMSLKMERERNSQLETEIKTLMGKMESYEALLVSMLNVENTDSTTDSKVGEELYRRASVIEAHQVTEDIDEAVELEGRPHAHHFQRESSKKRKWRRTGMKALSQDFRDLL